jgi:predicted PhzF superfamily epimerase YddE/YHI9
LDPVVCLQVDAFTDRPFRGNPAAVCLLEEGRDSEWMQAVAAEMNLSETAFVWPVGDGFDLRWFTPAVEVDLCGHATLAAAHALWSEGLVPGDGRISFQTRSGLLTAARVASPANLQADQIADLGNALGVEPDYVGRSVFDLLVVVGAEDVLRGLRPDFPRLRELAVRGIAVTSRDEQIRRSPLRFRLSVLCARRRYRRRSRHRVGALLPRPILERAIGQDRDDSFPGIGARRHRTCSPVR